MSRSIMDLKADIDLILTVHHVITGMFYFKSFKYSKYLK